MDTVNAKKRWTVIYWRVNKLTKSHEVTRHYKERASFLKINNLIILTRLISVASNFVKIKGVIIISLLMSPLQGTGLPYGLHTKRTGHNPPRGPCAGWWVLTTANAAGRKFLTCLPKNGGARDNKFLVTYPMTGQRCSTSAIARQSALTARPSSSSKEECCNNINWLLSITNWMTVQKKNKPKDTGRQEKPDSFKRSHLNFTLVVRWL
jgi:hypothetical protein